ncbi:MAG: DNA-3-methyladenine glycosylase [Gammaproteobacteria bacterium RIFCSPLOWO2_02_FULL_52_10]|nr:MAG: DNA-3-methyladenine glycosylase [Gammaproteobacteria bacterium RIFCSPLOWO2_02_FULL_52_10]
MLKRCLWAGNDPVYVRYHDREWGVPVHNDRKLFEFLVLEGAQAGLSWITVLKKRPAYRAAFDNFDFNTVAGYQESRVRELLKNAGIIRNELKIRSAIRNARAFISLRQEFGTFNRYIWQYVAHRPLQNTWRRMREIPPKTALSDKISQDLKRRGFSFVGSTIIYSHMQATGMVNDHTIDCFRYGEVKKLSKKLKVKS